MCLTAPRQWHSAGLPASRLAALRARRWSYRRRRPRHLCRLHRNRRLWDRSGWRLPAAIAPAKTAGLRPAGQPGAAVRTWSLVIPRVLRAHTVLLLRAPILLAALRRFLPAWRVRLQSTAGSFLARRGRAGAGVGGEWPHRLRPIMTVQSRARPARGYQSG